MILEEILLVHPTDRKAQFLAAAAHCGFELAGVAPAGEVEDYPIYRQWVMDGMAGPMGYLADRRGAVRRDPRELLPAARSLLCVGKLYKTKDIDHENATGAGLVSKYAWGAQDYHDVLRRGLERLVERLENALGSFSHRICVDTAPLLERSHARLAGLGWIGKNTCLINQMQGSWFFLGFVLTSLEMPPDAPPPDRCGTCRRCIDACPTQALVPTGNAEGPQWRLDARLCISTLTIETRGPAPEATRGPTGRHLFGCDICQDVCPWNRRAPETAEPGFHPVNGSLDLEEMACLSPEQFRERFRGTPVWRARYAGWLRNVATAMGNTRDPRHRAALLELSRHEDAGVAQHARWALARLEESD